MRAKYICFEGTEGVGKTTQVELLTKYLVDKGYKVLTTKEPGTPHNELTMTLRGIMLDNRHSNDMTVTARELVSQAIRSIHLEKVIVPALDKYDYIIQDRGILSGFAYGKACGNEHEFLNNLTNAVIPLMSQKRWTKDIYDLIIYFEGNTYFNLDRATNAKQEFEQGDAMESKGRTFMNEVNQNMYFYIDRYFRDVTRVVRVDDRTREDILNDVIHEVRGINERQEEGVT
jgi:dTMP kinase